jgi:hypothetical protein
LLGVGHDFLGAVDGEDSEFVPGFLAKLGRHLPCLRNGLAENLAEDLHGNFLSSTTEGGFVRRTPVEVFLMCQTSVAIESVYHLLVSERFTGTNHVDNKGPTPA